jgi:hypothetical protein
VKKAVTAPLMQSCFDGDVMALKRPPSGYSDVDCYRKMYFGLEPDEAMKIRDNPVLVNAHNLYASVEMNGYVSDTERKGMRKYMRATLEKMPTDGEMQLQDLPLAQKRQVEAMMAKMKYEWLELIWLSGRRQREGSNLLPPKAEDRSANGHVTSG